MTWESDTSLRPLRRPPLSTVWRGGIGTEVSGILLTRVATFTRFLVNGARYLIREMTLDFADRERPDITWIAEDLAIGGRVLDDEWPVIAKAGIGAVVDCRAEARDPVELLDRLGIAFLHLPTPDSGNFTPEQVAEGATWVQARWEAGQRVLVHCQAGRGRSVLIGASALALRGTPPDEALTLIRSKRPIVTPTPGQIARLRAFASGYQLALPFDGSS
jgi:protein tyrosine phosphatase (PTP) superfamily phosphohydrolase (DUF442 family)